MPDDAIRHQYERYGAQGYYEQFGAEYRNPHELAVRQTIHAAVAAWQLDLARVLDLACGSGEVTLALRELGATAIDGLDPYTGAAYQARTGQPADALSFEAIAGGALDGRRYSAPFGEGDKREWVRVMKEVWACASCRTYVDGSTPHERTCSDDELERLQQHKDRREAR